MTAAPTCRSTPGRRGPARTYPTGQFYNVFTTKHVPYHVCGAQQDNSTACVGSQANPGGGEGSLPPIFYAVGGGESGYIAPDPTNLNVFFAGSYGGYLSRLDRDLGQQRSVNIYPDNPMGWSSVDIKERFQWTYPIVFSHADPKVLYASSQHLWRTVNAGQSWERISPNLTRSDPKTMQASGGPITRDQTGVETYAVIFTVAPSLQDGNTIWTGSDDGWVHVTRDGGKNWERVTPPDLPDFTRISLIEASPHQNGVAYLAGNRYQQGDRKPYFYKTTDFGKTWTKIVSGIADTDFARTIREDKKRRGLLYAGTEQGIYISFDDGASWQTLRLNLPVTPVHGIVSEERDLVIGTHGRGFYVLDDINVLRQAAGDITARALHVFQPNDPLRGRDNNLTIDYHLGKDAERGEDRDPRCLWQRVAVVHRHRQGQAGGSQRDWRRRWVWWRRAAAAGHQEGHESVHLGSAPERRRRLSGDDHVGGAAGAWPGVAASEVRRASQRQRRKPDALLHHRHRSAAQGRRHHRGVPARAVQAVVAGAGPRDRREFRGDQDSRASANRSRSASRRSPSDAAPKCSGWSTR